MQQSNDIYCPTGPQQQTHCSGMWRPAEWWDGKTDRQTDDSCIDPALHIMQAVPIIVNLPSVLWRCWLGSRKGIQPVKTEWWGAGMVICLEQGADLHTSQLMPLPLTVSCFSKIQIGFTFLLVLAYLGSPKKGPLNGCVCVCANNCEISAFILFHTFRHVKYNKCCNKRNFSHRAAIKTFLAASLAH